MKTEKEIRRQIEVFTKIYRPALDVPFTSIHKSVPISLAQTNATVKLDSLYWVLGEARPRYKCDTFKRERRNKW